MAQEFSAELPTSSGHESDPTEENYIPKGFLFETPRELYTRAITIPEREECASPFFAQRSLGAFDTLGGDEDYRDIPLAVPRQYSDLIFERDPFIGSYGIPLNPHNTPISFSGRPSEIGSWGKDKQNVLSPVKSNRNSVNQPSDAALPSDTTLTSLFNGHRTKWTQPKPLKPPSLSDIDHPRGGMENIRPSLSVESLERWDDTIFPPETAFRSLPLRTGKGLNQVREGPVIEQAPEHHPPRPKQSWETRSVVPCRYFSPPFTSQELEILGIPLNNPDMPFPAPIPTIDNLPLRRDIVKFDWKQGDQCAEDPDGISTNITAQSMTPKPYSITALRLLRRVFALGKYAKSILSNIIPWARESLSTKEYPTLRNAMTIPFGSRCEAFSPELEQAAIVGPRVSGAFVIQVNFAFPLLFVHHLTIAATVIRGCMSSKIAMAVAFTVRYLLEIAIRWLLSALQIEVAVEMSRIQEEKMT